MRAKHVLVCMVAVLALASIGATTAFGDAGGTPNGGKSEAAHANHGLSDASHDPSNPDGTYQGKSGSTPDQDGIGADHGLDNNDKTGPGTDGNNGCGNDDPREDDNNGWCGNKPANEGPDNDDDEDGDDEGEEPEASPTATSQPGADVLGRTFTRPDVAGRDLARTGMPLMLFAIAAMALGVIGFALRAITHPRKG